MFPSPARLLQMGGFDWYDLIERDDEKILANEMECFKYPDDETINKVGLRGLFIGNFDPWDANEHKNLIMEKYDWQESSVEFERTYRKFSNLDDT